MQKLVLCLLLSAFCKPCPCQLFDEKKFIYYSATDGLTDNFITGLAQDDLGYIWISTTNGLNRFDGMEIQRIYQSPGKPGLIADKLDNIECKNNKLVLRSSKGAQWFDLKKNHFTSLLVSEANAASTFQNVVLDLTVLENNSCFVSTYTGAYAFDSNGQILFRYDYYRPGANGSLPEGPRYGRSVSRLATHQALHIDRNFNMTIYDSRKNRFAPIEEYKYKLPRLYSLKGMLNIDCIDQKNKLFFLSTASNELITYEVDKDHIMSRQVIPPWFQKNIGWASHFLIVNDSTALLFGGINGIYTINAGSSDSRLLIDSIPAFKNHVVTSVIYDRDYRLWVGTQNGLFKQKIKQTALHSIDLPFLNDPQINHPVSFPAFLRHKDLLYAGSYSYLPVAVLDGKTYRLKKQISFAKFSPRCNQIWNIIEYNKDTLWFGTQDGLIWYNSSNASFGRVMISAIDSLTRHAAITLLHKDSRGMIWIQPNWGTGIIVYNPVNRNWRRFSKTDKHHYLPLRVVNFITEDKEGNIWLAENGLTRWNRKKNEFDTLITTYSGFNKQNSKVLSLHNAQGNLIFCNENNGVLIYDPVARSYRQISTEQGLEENAVHSAIVLPNRYLWVVTHNYLTAVQPFNSKTISYSYSDSLPAKLFSNIYHDQVAGRIIIGYDNLVTWTEDSTAGTGKSIPFHIDAVRITNDTVLIFPGEKIELGHQYNDLTIHYSALNYDDAENNRYAYRINGKEWINVGNDNFLHFSNLSPGEYALEIKHYASSNTSIESIKKLVIVIHPPFWKSWWFFALAFILALTVVYLVYKNRIRHIRQKADIDRQLAQLELKALHTQMNPHFIFNCLNSIREMILNGEGQQASRYLSKFAHLIRLTLNQSSRPFISLQSTIDYLERYLEMEQIRTDRFSYQIEIDPKLQTENLMLPPMLIQPFVENAIWHGNPSQNGMLKILVRFFQKQNRLYCVIEDNGIGVEASLSNKKDRSSDHQPVGISNVKQRLQVLNEKYNLQSGISIDDKKSQAVHEGTGTVATIYFSIQNWDP